MNSFYVARFIKIFIYLFYKLPKFFVFNSFLKWFEEKTQEVENLSATLKKLHYATDALYGWRRGILIKIE